MNYDHYKFLSIAKIESVAIVTMNRPEQRNAVPPEAQIELERIWEDLGADSDVNAIVLTGAGDAFSAGGDLKQMAAMFGTPEGLSHALQAPRSARRLLQNLLDVPQPVVAAINGDAVGLGATLALLADVAVIADEAKFGDTHVKVGLVAGDGGTIIWPLLIGANRAKEFLMLGRLASGKECAQMGLINHAVPKSSVLEKAMGIAQELAANAPWAVRWTKMSVNQAIKQQMNLLLDASLAYEMLTMGTQDHLEATKAFLEKRTPQFRGR